MFEKYSNRNWRKFIFSQWGTARSDHALWEHSVRGGELTAHFIFICNVCNSSIQLNINFVAISNHRSNIIISFSVYMAAPDINLDLTIFNWVLVSRRIVSKWIPHDFSPISDRVIRRNKNREKSSIDGNGNDFDLFWVATKRPVCLG